jgi:hypothetical protein
MLSRETSNPESAGRGVSWAPPGPARGRPSQFWTRLCGDVLRGGWPGLCAAPPAWSSASSWTSMAPRRRHRPGPYGDSEARTEHVQTTCFTSKGERGDGSHTTPLRVSSQQK